MFKPIHNCIDQKRRITWLTNLPAPYRIPIWNYIAEHYELKVFFTNGIENKRKWTLPEEVHWDYEFMDKKIFYYNQAQIILNPLGFFRIVRVSETIIIGGGWEVPLHFCTALVGRIFKRKVFIIAESTLSSHRFRNKFVKLLRYLYFNLSNSVISVGSEASRAVVETGVSSRKIVEIFNPVDVSFFHRISTEHNFELRTGHRFLIVARLIEEKNLEEVMKAFSEMNEFEDELVVVGDGSLREKLMQLVNFLGISEQVSFLGSKSQDQVAKVYAEGGTLVLASKNETWGLVANEALAAGCHLVVSDKCGVSEFVKNMRGVFLCGIDSTTISAAMRMSRQSYSGKIANPEVLKFSPEKFASILLNNIFKF